MDDDSGLPRKKRGVNTDTGGDRPSKKSMSNSNPPENTLLWDADTLRYQNKAMIKKIEMYKQQIDDLKRQTDDAERKKEISNQHLTIADLAWKQLHEGLRQTLNTLVGNAHPIDTLKVNNRKPTSKGTSFITSLINSSLDNDDTQDEYSMQEVERFFANRNKSVADVLSRVVDATEEQQRHAQSLTAGLKSEESDARLRVALSDIEKLRSENTSLTLTLEDVRSQNVTLRTRDGASRGVTMKLEEKLKKVNDNMLDLREQLEEARSKQLRSEARLREQLQNLQTEFDTFKSNSRNAAAAAVTTSTTSQSNGSVNMTPSDAAEMAELVEISNKRLSALTQLQEERITHIKELEGLKAEMHSLPNARVMNSRQYIQLQSSYNYLAAQVDPLRAEIEELNFQLKNERIRSADDRARILAHANEDKSKQEHKMKQTEHDLFRYRDARDKMSDEIAALKKSQYSRETVMLMREQLSARDGEITKLREQCEKYKEESKKFQSESKKGSTDYNSAVYRKECEVRDLEGKVRDLEKAVSAHRPLKKQWEEKERELKVIIDVYQRESRDRRDIHEIRVSEMKYRDEVMRLEERLSRSNPASYDIIQELEARITSQEEKKKEMTERLMKAEKSYKEMKTQYDQQKTALDTYTSELNEVTLAYEESSEQVRKLTHQLVDKEDSLTRFIADSLRKESLNKMEQEEKRLTDEKIKHLDAKMIAKDELCKDLESKIYLLDTQLTQTTSDLKKLEEVSSWDIRQNKDLNEQIKAINANIERQEREFADVTNRLQEKCAELEVQKNRCSASEEHVAGLTAKIQKMKNIGFTEEDHGDQLYKRAYDDLKRHINCSVCNERQRDTIIMKCCHTFCNPCIRKKIELRSRKCPSCNKPFGEGDVHSYFYQ